MGGDDGNGYSPSCVCVCVCVYVTFFLMQESNT